MSNIMISSNHSENETKTYLNNEKVHSN